MARPGDLDPLTRYRYLVYIKVDRNSDFFTKLGFTSVTNPRVDLSYKKYTEGGRHLNPRNILQGATFSPITMRRGKTFSRDFLNWIGMTYKAIYGDERKEPKEKQNYRGTVIIDHLDRRGNVVKKYILESATPSAYLPASNFNSADDSQVSLESLTFEYEGFREISLDQAKLANLVGGAGAGLLTDSQTSLESGFATPAKEEPADGANPDAEGGGDNSGDGEDTGLFG